MGKTLHSHIRAQVAKDPRKIYVILICFSIYNISPFIICTVRSPLVDNKICMTTTIGAVVTKLCQQFILDTVAICYPLRVEY